MTDHDSSLDPKNAAQPIGLIVELGAHVEVILIDEMGGREALAFDIVPDEQADFASGFLGAGTPLAQALLGHVAGSVLSYRVGDVVQVQIAHVSAAARTPAEDVAARRQAVLQQAVAESDRVSDMVFALAVGSKWGDYDPGDLKS